MKFNDVVDVIKSLSTDEKREISLLLQQYLREESRDQIYENFQLAKQEEKQEELIFSSQINRLKELLE
ncbi:hypothetical protein [Spirulina subsalsa]|uniref:hypothetical protein n=1 Tax=Spirulina subsalsa TaxID=54311 RepID=UPI00031D8CCB|nr:hypothetical protein [Spirulina subsalsa]